MGRTVSPGDRDILAAVLVEVAGALGPVALDGWLPPVQGAVGVVAGMRRRDDPTPLVVKVYRGDHAQRRKANEETALRLLAGKTEFPAPRVVAASATVRAGTGWLVMDRRPGLRWGDRREAMSERENREVIRRVGRMLRDMHRVAGRTFGPLAEVGRQDPLDAAMDRLAQAVALSADGSDDTLGRRVVSFVRGRAGVLRTCVTPVFCHADFNGGNLLVDDCGQISGVVDFERSRWDDPLSDLALTKVHVAHHDPAMVGDLERSYGPLSGAERTRLDVFELLQRFHERQWVAHDRPAGWREARAALDAALERMLG